MRQSELRLSARSRLSHSSLAITGPGVDDLREGEDLVVLAIGKLLPDAQVPLVVPKVKLEVTLAAGEYVLAQPPEVTERVKSMLLDMARETTIKVRPSLPVEDKDIDGNPARQAVRSGARCDERHRDFAVYIEK